MCFGELRYVDLCRFYIMKYNILIQVYSEFYGWKFVSLTSACDAVSRVQSRLYLNRLNKNFANRYFNLLVLNLFSMYDLKEVVTKKQAKLNWFKELLHVNDMKRTKGRWNIWIWIICPSVSLSIPCKHVSVVRSQQMYDDVVWHFIFLIHSVYVKLDKLGFPEFGKSCFFSCMKYYMVVLL